ncbi:hypothetical protein MVLG_05438 [Microbotryum lychnidis-dioicae p1A1 Lamole]|uniref:Uncharacterized protein n=1 Tax=Microbotryum lychnidis-dioicae (strain p1A1 Lamole / MvSl-1064) TaxID=683840 RepID=U5HE92_USTV1|nr:hypothetical protein MVLG_05438 [Microbotryum lychnidis-dioicae p1A1 Lamole]|eukprot:KDE04067.1 hypothetical protein MVLG_05438 [Microbotryum lychnidis-dioicae p1A1 Lamole]
MLYSTQGPRSGRRSFIGAGVHPRPPEGRQPPPNVRRPAPFIRALTHQEVF